MWRFLLYSILETAYVLNENQRITNFFTLVKVIDVKVTTVIMEHTIKISDSRGTTPRVLNWAVDRDVWSASCYSRLTPKKRTPCRSGIDSLPGLEPWHFSLTIHKLITMPTELSQYVEFRLSLHKYTDVTALTFASVALCIWVARQHLVFASSLTYSHLHKTLNASGHETSTT